MSSPSRKRRRGPLTQDFELLASRYSDFATEWRRISSSLSQLSNNDNHTRSLASKSTPAFQLSLTRALLDFHFGLKLPSLPEDRLCPPIPNRWCYCDWVLHELMPSLTNPKHFDTSHQYEVQNWGLDIGTGASAIYPLLLVTNDANLQMLASEVDPISLASAKTNIVANNLYERITLIQVAPNKASSNRDKSKGPLLQALDNNHNSNNNNSKSTNTAVKYLDFVLTNPPFFDEPPPGRADGRARTPMTQTESIYQDGGEVGWVLDILRDSWTTRTSIGWYTTMLCKKTSFVTLRRILLEFLGPGHVRSTELEVGSMTRWFLAWTYHRPCGQTPVVETKSLEIVVRIEELHQGTITRDEVADRLKLYCTSIPGWGLACSEAIGSSAQNEDGAHFDLIVTENNPPMPASYMVEEKGQLPARILMGDVLASSALTARNWLPVEGHFVLRFRLEEVSANAVKVTANGYKHSTRGGKAIEKILSRVEGDVCRTNRRWRRLLARKEQQSATG